MEIEKKLELNGPDDVREYGIDNYNEACRSIVLRYTDLWRQTVTRLGRWVDFDNDYKTMDPSFMESVWWVFKQLNENARLLGREQLAEELITQRAPADRTGPENQEAARDPRGAQEGGPFGF